jgi:hypothetical protein
MRSAAGLKASIPNGIAPLNVASRDLNMAACSAYLEQVTAAARLKDRPLNLDVFYADLLMWWYGAAGAAR